MIDAATADTLPRQSTARYRELILVVALALGLRVCFALLTANSYDYDEFVLLLLGRDFAHGDIPYQDFMFFHPPGFLVLLRVLEPLTAFWWPIARLLMVVADTATAGLVWCIARALYNHRVALAAGILYAMSPLALISAVRVGQDPIITFLGMAGLTLLACRRGAGSARVAGFCLALAIWFKYPAILFIPAYLLVAPRRVLAWLVPCLLAIGLLFAAFLPEAHALYRETVAFQRTRWPMPLQVRFETIALYWLLVNPLAVVALLRRLPVQPWVPAGFLVGGVFLLASQVYYHYFVLVVPFAALLGAPLLVRVRIPRMLGAPLILVVVAAWAAVIDLGGQSPVFVTSAHLSDLAPTVQILDRTTHPTQPILVDRYEYAYLAHRPALAHYFWNVGVLVDARWLERRLHGSGAVVLSYGASSGYPAGFVQYLNRHYPSVPTPVTRIWLLNSK